MRDETGTCLDIAFDYAEAGLYDEALALLDRIRSSAHPAVGYTIAWLLERSGNPEAAAKARQHTTSAVGDYYFPNRLEEEIVLREAIVKNPADPRAPYYLGCYLYDKKRVAEAIEMWELARERDPEFATTHRNLGIAYYNVQHDGAKALASYERAFELNRDDARVLYELDQLRKKLGHSPHERLASLDQYPQLIDMRDDLSIEHAALLNALGLHERALKIVQERTFHPWEGGEGKVLAQHVATHLGLGRAALDNGDAAKAYEHFQAAMNPPRNLGEARHLLAATADIDYHLGLAAEALGKSEEAREHFTRAAEAKQDFQEMAVASFS
jgi:tetratricopeptide (TPR) repeat protein